jgi:hypothetical protein
MCSIGLVGLPVLDLGLRVAILAYAEIAYPKPVVRILTALITAVRIS